MVFNPSVTVGITSAWIEWKCKTCLCHCLLLLWKCLAFLTGIICLLVLYATTVLVSTGMMRFWAFFQGFVCICNHWTCLHVSLSETYVNHKSIHSDSVWNVLMQFQEEEASNCYDGDSGVSLCSLLGPFPCDPHDDRIQWVSATCHIIKSFLVCFFSFLIMELQIMKS